MKGQFTTESFAKSKTRRTTLLMVIGLIILIIGLIIMFIFDFQIGSYIVLIGALIQGFVIFYVTLKARHLTHFKE